MLQGSRHAALAVLILALAPVLAGCSATKVSTEEEIRMGQQAAQALEREYRVRNDSRVSSVGQRLAMRSKRPDLPWSFKVIERSEVNAVSLPGGPVYVYEGLLQEIGGNEDMLAAVLGHEIGHVEGRHAAKQIERSQWFGLGSGILDRVIGGDVGAISQVVGNLQLLSYSRQQEYQSDDRALDLMLSAGYNPQGLVSLLQLLERQGGGGSINWLRSHPSSENRVRRAQERVSALRR